MEPLVADTDVLSYIFKDDTRAEAYRPLLAGRMNVVSFMTLAELHLWAEESQWGSARRVRLEAYLKRFIVAPYEADLCRVWSAVTYSARRAGRPIQVADAWIAATAVLYGLPLVTNNPSDYLGVAGLRLLTAQS